MSYDIITVTPSSPHIGAEIGNIDLTRPLSNRQVQEVHDAIIEHGVLFFREQKLDFASHERFVRYFGEPHIHVGGYGTASKAVPGHPAIRKQYFDADSKRVSGEEWHSDQSCAEIARSLGHSHQLKDVTVRVLEINATAAIPIIKLAVIEAPAV